MSRTGRPNIGHRPMTSTERARASRARKRAPETVKMLAERPEKADTAELTRLTSGGTPAVGPSAAPVNPPPPLPTDPIERTAAMQAEIELAMRQVVFDPASPPAARVAARRSLAEMAGLLHAGRNSSRNAWHTGKPRRRER
jgi:hypothetical protein